MSLDPDKGKARRSGELLKALQTTSTWSASVGTQVAVEAVDVPEMLDLTREIPRLLPQLPITLRP
jgi:hypothetical protein